MDPPDPPPPPHLRHDLLERAKTTREDADAAIQRARETLKRSRDLLEALNAEHPDRHKP